MEIEDGFSRGDIVRICNISLKALRYYEKIGLLVPYYTDPDNNRKIYSHNQLYYVSIIQSLKESKFPLEKIKQISFENNFDSVINLFNEQIINNKKEITNLLRANEQNERWIGFLKWLENSTKSKASDEQFYIKTLDAKNVAFIRKKDAMADKTIFFKRYISLNNTLQKNAIIPNGFYYSIIHERLSKVDFNNVDWELFVEVGENTPKTYNFIREIPGCTFACTIHKGFTKYKGESHLKLKEWIKSNNYKIIGPMYTRYILPLGIVKSEEQLVVEILRPVEKIKQ